ncbi:TetR/AcrR family transcriptional regulator [candidate division KSB1 bacterium]|nr:TetR/AcrR family transcriptional regulator [candidate division KSB1 bacterium]
MDNKAIQEQRMREYFIQATREILKGEGLRGISVRNIASKAGYSYATLYNYFKDVKELIFECVQDFQDECEEMVQSEIQNTPQGLERIKAITMAYMKYFIQYQGIFELFFLEGVVDMSGKKPTIELIVTFLDRLCESDWEYCISQNQLTKEQAEIHKAELRYVAPGLLLFYLNRKHPESYNEFKALSERQLNFILKN